MTAMMPAKGNPKERFDHILTNQLSEALRQTIHREDKTRHQWSNKWRSDWRTQYGHTKIWGFDDYDPNNYDGEPLNRDYARNKRDAMSARDIANDRGVRGGSGRTTNSTYGYTRSSSSRDEPVVGVHRDFSSRPSSSHRSASITVSEEAVHLPAAPPPSQTIERKVVRQVSVPVVRRVRVPVATFGAPPNRADGYRIDELRGHKIVEVEEVQRWRMQPEPIGQPSVISQRDIAMVDDNRRVGVQIFPANDDRIRGIEEDPSIVNRPTVSRIDRPSSAQSRRPSSNNSNGNNNINNRPSSASGHRSSSSSSSRGRSVSPSMARPSSSSGQQQQRPSSTGTNNMKRAPSPSPSGSRPSSGHGRPSSASSVAAGNKRASSPSLSSQSTLIRATLPDDRAAVVRGVSPADLAAIANGESRPQSGLRTMTPSKTQRGWR